MLRLSIMPISSWRAVASDGTVRPLPEALARRDASGQPLDNVVGSVGSAVGVEKLAVGGAAAEASAPAEIDGADTLF